MSTPAPDLVINCTTGESSLAPLEGDRLTQWQADQQAATDQAAQEAATATAWAWVEFRMIRDRWLAQTDYVESFINDPTVLQHLPVKVQGEITANASGWVAWRQSLRDLPSANGLDPVSTVAAAGRVHSTVDSFPAPWSQPPAAPVIHLT